MKNRTLKLSFLILFFISFLLISNPTISAGWSDAGTLDSPLVHFGNNVIGYQLRTGTFALLYLDTGQTECYNISAPKAFFVPTKTTAEWASFVLASRSLGVTLTRCPTPLDLNLTEARVTAVSNGDTNSVSLIDQSNSARNKLWQDLLMFYDGDTQSAGETLNRFDFYTALYGMTNQGADAADLAGFFEAYPQLGEHSNFWKKYGTDVNSYLTTGTRLVSISATYQGTFAAYMNILEGNEGLEISHVDTPENYGDYCGDGACIDTNAQGEVTRVYTVPYFYCFTEDTLILTTRGEIKIKDIQANDKIISFNIETNHLVESQLNKKIIHPYSVDWYYLIKTANSNVEVTGIHPFYVGNGEYKEADKLREGDLIYINLNGKLVQEEILSKERIDLTNLITVYNLELEEDSPRNYFANGYLVHNKADPDPDPDPSETETATSTGGSGCFVEGTLIETIKGDKDISKLDIEDSVLSYNSLTDSFVYSEIQKILIHKENTNWYYFVKTANSQVEVTDVHPFYVGNGKYARIENLNKGDLIYINLNGKLVQEEILSKERIDLPKLITVYNLELNKDGPRNYFANGYLVHNGDKFWDWLTGNLVNDK